MPDSPIQRADALRNIAQTLGIDVFVPGALLGDVLPVAVVGETGVRKCLGFGSTAAVAGVNGHVLLQNPAESGVLVTVTRIDFSDPSAAGDLYLNGYSAFFGTASTTKAVVTPLRSNSPGVLPQQRIQPQAAIGVGTTGAVLGAPITRFRVQAGVSYVFQCQIELEPPNGVMIVNPTANSPLRVAYSWEERPLRLRPY